MFHIIHNFNVVLKVQNLSKKFGHIKALNKLTFSVPKGQVIAIVGPNGCGKTTLFNIITGAVRQNSGKVYLDGIDLNGLDSFIISNLGVSRMFQRSRLFENLTVGENLLLSINNDDTKLLLNIFVLNKINPQKSKIIEKSLKNLNLYKYINSKVNTLSYGQKRLVEIVRTVIKPHKILLLDEPTAGVNPITIAEIKKIIAKLKNEGDTVVIIEHNMDFVKAVADKIVLMNEGKLLLTECPEKVFTSETFIKTYFS